MIVVQQAVSIGIDSNRSTQVNRTKYDSVLISLPSSFLIILSKFFYSTGTLDVPTRGSNNAQVVDIDMSMPDDTCRRRRWRTTLEVLARIGLGRGGISFLNAQEKGRKTYDVQENLCIAEPYRKMN